MLDLVARRFRTLGEPYRLRILQVLEEALLTGHSGSSNDSARHRQDPNGKTNDKRG